MATMQQLVVSVFRDRAQAEQAADELLRLGLSNDQIRFAGHGAPTGGGFLDKMKSLFTGQDASSGAVYNDLVDMGTPPEDAQYYQSEYEAGHSVLAVQAGGRAQEVRDLLASYGGYGADQRFAQGAEASAATGTRETRTGMRGPSTQDEQSLKLHEEELQASKQSVEKGEVRVRKEIVTEQKTIDVPVTREEVYIERRPGSGQPSDIPIAEGETYRIPIREEEVTVEKRPVEREEVILGKQPIEETRRVSDSVQREEARVEREGDVDIQGRVRGTEGRRRRGEGDIQGREAESLTQREREREIRGREAAEDLGERREDVNLPRRDYGPPDQPTP